MASNPLTVLLELIGYDRSQGVDDGGDETVDEGWTEDEGREGEKEKDEAR